jgi:hypothetical protein
MAKGSKVFIKRVFHPVNYMEKSLPENPRPFLRAEIEFVWLALRNLNRQCGTRADVGTSNLIV